MTKPQRRRQTETRSHPSWTHLLHALILSFFLSTAAAQSAEQVELLYTYNLSDIANPTTVNDITQLATLLKNRRQESPGQFFFLHGGNSLAPSVLSSIDKGADMISLLNLLQPDLMAVAKRELTYGEDELTLRSMEASFPIVASNIVDPLTSHGLEGITPSYIITTGDGQRIGILVLVDPECIVEYMPQRISVTDSTVSIEESAAKLREDGAEMVMLMADYHVAELEKLIARKTINLAIIRKSENTTVRIVTKKNNTLIALKKTHPLRLCIRFPSGKDDLPEISTGLYDISALPADRLTAAHISSSLSYLQEVLAEVIGHTATRIDTRRESVRSSENGFANFIADVLRNFYHADIALINGGCIRGNREYPAKTVLTRGIIWRELPFGNRIVQIRVTGQQIRTAIENGLSRVEDSKGRFPHVSGIQVTWNPNRPPGKRVLRIMKQGKPLQMMHTYQLATTDYLAKGGDGYTSLTKGVKQVKEGGGLPLWEYVRQEIIRQSIIFPRIEGRMQVVDNDATD